MPAARKAIARFAFDKLANVPEAELIGAWSTRPTLSEKIAAAESREVLAAS